MSWLAHSVCSHVNGLRHQVTARCSGFTVFTKHSLICNLPPQLQLCLPRCPNTTHWLKLLVPTHQSAKHICTKSYPSSSSGSLEGTCLCALPLGKWVAADHGASSSDHPNSSSLACSGQRLSLSDTTPFESAVFSAFQVKQTPAHACSYSSPPFLHAAGYPSLYLWTWTCLPCSLASFLAYAQAEKPNHLLCRAHLCKVHPIFHFWMSHQKPVMVISLRVRLRLLRQSFSYQRNQ